MHERLFHAFLVRLKLFELVIFLLVCCGSDEDDHSDGEEDSSAFNPTLLRVALYRHSKNDSDHRADLSCQRFKKKANAKCAVLT